VLMLLINNHRAQTLLSKTHLLTALLTGKELLIVKLQLCSALFMLSHTYVPGLFTLLLCILFGNLGTGK